MNQHALRRIRPWLGTYVHVDVTASDKARAEAALEAAYAEIAAIHHAMSFHTPDSDLARVNREAYARPVSVGPHTWAVLSEACRLARLSNGVFDPTTAPALVRHGALPTPDAPQPDKEGRWHDIEFDESHRQIRFRRPLWIDLGGIAKGYAVDQAIAALQQHGATQGCVNAGGDLRCFGEDPRGQPVVVRHPADPRASIPLGRIANRAVASSGDYFLGRSSDSADVSPIVDPGRGIRSARARSVTVIAETCCVADALTKIVSLLGKEAGPVLDNLGACAAIIEPPDTLHASPGFWQALGHDPVSGPTFHA